MNETPDLLDASRREGRERPSDNIEGDFRIRRKRFAQWRPLMLVLVPGLLIAIAISLLSNSTATGDFIGGTLLFSTLAGVVILVLCYGDGVKGSVGINGTKSEAVTTEKRQTRMAHVLVSMAALVVPILLIMTVRFFTDHELGARSVGFICLGCLFFSFREQVYQLGNWIEKKFGRSGPEVQSAPSLTKDLDRIDWSILAVNVFAFLAVTLMIGLAAKSLEAKRLTQSMSNASEPMRQSTPVYWQSAVASLHVLRFQTPSGKESARNYFDRMFQQLRSLTDAAQLASTTNVDPDLVRMTTRHLAVEDRCLELKKEMDELMQRQQIPSSTDTVDQHMETVQLLLNLIGATPDAIGKLPPGLERDLVEKCLALEQTRQEQFREIEIMQAVLQERYRGIAFPLPVVAQ